MVGCYGRFEGKGNAICQPGSSLIFIPHPSMSSYSVSTVIISSIYQALLSGCSAGGLASILKCDDFRGLFSSRTKVKCLSDGGLFLNA